VKRLWPFDHLGLKLLSVGLALLLWFVISGDETVERGLRVPLELQQFPQGLELQSEPPALVDIRVRGSSDTLSRVGPGDIVAVLDLHTARPGRRLFQLTPEQMRTPFGVEVMQVAPASIALVFENSAAKRVPVVPSVEGDPAPGYVRGAWTSDPAMVEITGPESAVKETTEALTEPISIAGATADVTGSVTLGVLDPALRVKTPRQATVRVQILPGPRERTVRNRPVRLRDVTPNLVAQVLPPDVDVILRGSREGLAHVDAEQVMPFVDLKGLGAGEYTLAVRIDDLPDAGFVRTEPTTVKVRIGQ
jgi:YbbR domain-containing protein